MVMASFKTKSNFPQNNINIFKLIISIKKKLLQHIITSLNNISFLISIIKQFLLQLINNLFSSPFPKRQKMKISYLAAQ